MQTKLICLCIRVTSETFRFFKCLRADQQPISACSRENYQLVEMALEGMHACSSQVNVITHSDP